MSDSESNSNSNCSWTGNESDSSESIVSCSSNNILDYDDTDEPLATEEEAREYDERVEREKKLHEIVDKRFTGEISIHTW